MTSGTQAPGAPGLRLLPVAQAAGGAAIALAMALVATATPWGAASVVKLAVLLTLAVGCALAHRKPAWRMASAGAFLLLSAYNVGQHLRGERDCGCFPIEVPPLVTAAFDLLVCWFLAIGDRHVMRMPLTALLASVLVSAGLWLGHDGGLRRVLDEPPAQPSITVGTGLAFTFPGASLLLVVDPACRKCRAAVQEGERAAREGVGDPVFVLDLGRGDIRELSSGLRIDASRVRPLAEQLAGVEVPMRLRVDGSTVTAIEQGTAAP